MPADWPSTNEKPLQYEQGLLGDSILYLETLNQSQGDSYHALAVVGSRNMHCTTISRWSPARLQWGHHLSAVETPSAWATSPASSTGFNGATAFRQWKHARSAVGTVGFGSASMGPPPFGSGNQNPPPLGQVVCLASMGPPPFGSGNRPVPVPVDPVLGASMGPPPFGSGNLRRLPAALEPVALAVHLQDMDVVGEPVQQRAGEAFRTEHPGPLIEGQVGGDQDGPALVALAEDLQEEVSPGGGQGDEAQFVDDQQAEAGKLPLQVEQPSLVPGLQRSALPRFHRRRRPSAVPQPMRRPGLTAGI